MSDALLLDIDVLLLDIGGVLVDVRRDLAQREWTRRTGLPGETFDAAVFGAGRKDAFDRGDLTPEAFFAAAAHDVGADTGPGTAGSEARAASLRDPLRPAVEAAFRAIVQPRPWVVTALEPLVGRVRLALFSNIDPVHHEVFAALPVAGLFEVAALSYRLRARKPERSAYRGALALLGQPPPERVLFADDLLENVDAARALGFRAVHVGGEATLRLFLADLRDEVGEGAPQAKGPAPSR